MIMYLVEGVHFTVPGTQIRICATREVADREALRMVNAIRHDAKLAPMGVFEEALQDLIENRPDLAMEPDVWVSEHEVYLI